MRSSSFTLLVILIISLLLLRPSSSDATIKCKDIAKSFKPCIDWMTIGYKRIGVAPKACCDELFKLNSKGINHEAEIAICECVKSEMQDLNIIGIVAESLSGRCGVLLPVPITPKVNCSEQV
ncbi:non-specific lipid-transfer protein 8-like [Lycium ferocissimum]|uniref:non-specific lipid-transfer protein 8-like n=1 Tax=Lycium ferocissimum TaxID=112874 RepID=UPI0028166D6D|nr:non-specific lipid-transfer protein 8-like [Lycium ferocissimum]